MKKIQRHFYLRLLGPLQQRTKMAKFVYIKIVKPCGFSDQCFKLELNGISTSSLCSNASRDGSCAHFPYIAVMEYPYVKEQRTMPHIYCWSATNRLNNRERVVVFVGTRATRKYTIYILGLASALTHVYRTNLYTQFKQINSTADENGSSTVQSSTTLQS